MDEQEYRRFADDAIPCSDIMRAVAAIGMGRLRRRSKRSGDDEMSKVGDRHNRG